MKLAALLPLAGQLKLIQGVEADLLRRKRRGMLGGMAAIVAGVWQVAAAATSGKSLDKLGTTELTVLGLGLLGLATYLTMRWTNLLVKESEEPFRYTFWIKAFELVSGTAGTRVSLKTTLHHDLMERLTYRMTSRLALLNADAPAPGAQEQMTSHIQITGKYAVREEHKGEWVLSVTPLVRIGPPSKPETISYPVKFPLSPPSGQAASSEDNLDADQYNQLVEQVYSRVATAVYKQILEDVRGKIHLFPTNYLRAVALFHEARDFERSNTIDAYDYAIELYREAKRFFDIRLTSAASRVLLRVPLLWRLSVKSELMRARARTGYARCLVYRRVSAALSGQSLNPLFEIPGELERAVETLTHLHNRIHAQWRLRPRDAVPEDERESVGRRDRFATLMAFLTFPQDSPLRRRQPLAEKHRDALFEAYTVGALAYARLGAPKRAKEWLDRAKAVAPVQSQRSPLWLLAAAETNPDMKQSILGLRQATELAPDFEIAQYRLAYYTDMLVRIREELTRDRVARVAKEYAEVLRINPGNIGALVARGYLWWLLGDRDKGDLDEAEKSFREGREIKGVVRQTFVGDLNYGLARIAAERGRFPESYNLYAEAMAADPAVGAYSPSTGPRLTNAYYEYIVPAVRDRYERFRATVDQEIDRALQPAGAREDAGLRRTLDGVRSFVLNDYGNAFLSHFHRFGDRRSLNVAVDAFEEATRINPENAVAFYNLSNAYLWQGDPLERAVGCLEQAERLAPAWPAVLTESAKMQIGQIQNRIEKKRAEHRTAAMELEQVREQEADRNLASAGKQADDKSGAPSAQEAPTSQPRARTEEYAGKVETLVGEIRSLAETLAREAFPKLEGIVERTKLASLFEGLRIGPEGEGVGRFLATRVGRDKLDDTDIDFLLLWADVLSNQTQSDQALLASQDLCRYIERYRPENIWTNRILYYVYTRLKPPERSAEAKDAAKRGVIETIQHWLDEDPIHWASLSWADEFFDMPQRVRAYHTAVRLDRRNDVYANTLASIYYAQRDFRNAIANYLEAIQRAPGNAAYRNALGNAYFNLLDYARAVEAYQAALALDGGLAVYHANLALTYARLEAWDRAIEAYTKAIELEPTNAGHQNDLGNVCFSRAEYARAAEAYEAAIARDAEVGVYHANLGLAHARLKAWDRAIVAYREAIRLEPKNAGHHNDLGNVYFSQEDYARAVEAYQAAIDRNNAVAVYHANLGLACAKREARDKAIEAYGKAIELEPANAGHRNGLGNVYFAQEDYARAVEAYQAAIERDATVAVYHANLGLAQMRRGEWESAIKAYGKAIELEPANAGHRNSLGNVYFAQEDYARAVDAYQAAIKWDATVAVYHSNLGLAYARLQAWDRAIEVYREAIRIEPAKAAHYNELANAYYNTARYRDAVAICEQAVALEPDNDLYSRNLAEARRQLGSQ